MFLYFCTWSYLFLNILNMFVRILYIYILYIYTSYVVSIFCLDLSRQTYISFRWWCKQSGVVVDMNHHSLDHQFPIAVIVLWGSEVSSLDTKYLADPDKIWLVSDSISQYFIWIPFWWKNDTLSFGESMWIWKGSPIWFARLPSGILCLRRSTQHLARQGWLHRWPHKNWLNFPNKKFRPHKRPAASVSQKAWPKAQGPRLCESGLCSISQKPPNISTYHFFIHLINGENDEN